MPSGHSRSRCCVHQLWSDAFISHLSARPLSVAYFLSVLTLTPAYSRPSCSHRICTIAPHPDLDQRAPHLWEHEPHVLERDQVGVVGEHFVQAILKAHEHRALTVARALTGLERAPLDGLQQVGVELEEAPDLAQIDSRDSHGASVRLVLEDVGERKLALLGQLDSLRQTVVLRRCAGPE